VEAVEDALQSPDVRVRAGALSTLAMIETLGPRSVSALERGLADPDERVRAAAIAGYGAHPETAKDVDGLLARLDDGSDRVRAAAWRRPPWRPARGPSTRTEPCPHARAGSGPRATPTTSGWRRSGRSPASGRSAAGRRTRSPRSRSRGRAPPRARPPARSCGR